MRTTLRLLSAAFVLASSTAWSAVVWQLNPNSLNQAVGSASLALTSQGFQITARGYDNNNGTGIAHQLYFKNVADFGGAIERGLGLVGTNHNELQVNPNGTPANFIQLDLRAILLQGFTNGMLSVGSVQAGESFRLFGSNAQGVLGTQLAIFGSAFDNQFVAIPNFGMFQFVSVTAGLGDVLPVAFRATPIPEMGALLPIVALLLAIAITHLLRRRRLA